MEEKSWIGKMMMKDDVFITDTNCITPLGFDLETNLDELIKNNSGIRLCSTEDNSDSFYLSKIDQVTLNNAFTAITNTTVQYTKLEKMLILALKPLIEKNGFSSKTGILFSTTKGNIDLLHDGSESGVLLSDLAKKVTRFFDINTEPIIVSNACVSGVLSIAVAKRMMQSSAYDDFYIVAGDIVSDFVISGFNSFQALSDAPCKPYDESRKGVTLGEAGVAVYMSIDNSKITKDTVTVIGDGAINDANHISGPSRTGEGLYQSIESAFKEAAIAKEELDYISAHGTATLYNDEMESIAFSRSGINKTPLNSLKGYYGHTLGASGLLESVIAIGCVNKDLILASKGYENKGVTHDISVSNKNRIKKITYFLKTASGFGGCNTAVLFKKTLQ